MKKIFLIALLIFGSTLQSAAPSGQSFHTQKEIDYENKRLLHIVNNSSIWIKQFPQLADAFAKDMQDAINNGATNLKEALSDAAYGGYLTAIKIFLKNSVDVNAIREDDGSTPLLRALKSVYNNDNPVLIPIVEVLLEAGSNLSIKNKQGENFFYLVSKLSPNIRNQVIAVYKEYAQNKLKKLGFLTSKDFPLKK